RVAAGSGAPLSAAEATNRICARCHQVLFSGYPHTWEGRARRGDAQGPGGSHINSGEARDFLLGACSRAMACTACHDPHGEDSAEALARLRTPAGNAVCTRCHAELAAGPALAAHARHRPDGEGGACLNCHLPKKNLGLSYQLTGYHRIGSPTDRARVESDRPLECALCHTGATTAELLGQMERLWGKRYDREALAALYGDLDRPVLQATLERGKAHEQAAALGALAARGDARAVPAMLPAMENRYPLIRLFARACVQRLAPGCEVDVEQPVEAIRAQAQRCIR
ncbi:MAG TPA: cytochrome c3 family protein, partial [Myxococcales bacterium]|nr:cytochrome c3 family protein [Myxococcales bacterium]